VRATSSQGVEGERVVWDGVSQYSLVGRGCVLTGVIDSTVGLEVECVGAGSGEALSRHHVGVVVGSESVTQVVSVYTTNTKL